MLINVKQIFTIFNMSWIRHISPPKIFLFTGHHIQSRSVYLAHIKPGQTNPSYNIHHGTKCGIKTCDLAT